jgi:UDP-N-acetylglucosamine--N-acetylmuramyl-(pentapeptide) pyrophosphoryl-undecaprenol N-acetylglucosamine transferase
VLHQTGRKNYEDVVNSVKEHGLKIGESGYTPWPFFSAEELADALSQATLVVSRAGAGSIAELAAASKAAILIPLMNAANDEQRLNAYDVAALGGALVLEEPNLGEHILFQKIEELLNDAELRKTMAVKLHSFYHPNAADAIADGVMSLMKKT